MSNATSWFYSAQTHFNNASNSTTDYSQRELAKGLNDLAYAMTRLGRRVYRRIRVQGKIDRQPWKPLPEPEHDRGMNLTLYRLTHFRETRLAHRLSRLKRNAISFLRRNR